MGPAMACLVVAWLLELACDIQFLVSNQSEYLTRHSLSATSALRSDLRTAFLLGSSH